MSISQFKFVSPGVYVNEIDKSQNPAVPQEVGPVVIGRTVRGPGMRPVRVPDYATFVETFGEPHPGGKAGDAWREGNFSAPTYGAYAAKAYLANGGPVTVVRLLGYENPTVTAGGEAGWKIDNSPTTASVSANGGAYGLFVIPIVSSSDNTFSIPSATGTLAAVFYVTGGTVGLTGKPLVGASETIIDKAGVWVRSATDGQVPPEFKVKISGSGVAETIAFNFNESSKNYVRNVFNTNPVAINSDLITSGSKNYFLGETFATAVNDLSLASGGSYAAIVLALVNGSLTQADQRVEASDSSTGWIVAQHKGVNTSFVADANGEYPVQKLFKVVSLTEGEWNQRNVKISISDIKPSTNLFNKFGTFTLSVRRMNDNDLEVKPLEVFSGLSLDPSSPNYIAKRIGDVYSEWDYDNKKFTEFGTYPNNSKFVRVQMNPDIEAVMASEPDLLPFGFYAPEVIDPITMPASSTSAAITGFASTRFVNAAISASNAVSGNASYSASLSFPSIPMVDSSLLDSPASSLSQVYWGVKTNAGSSKRLNADLVDTIRPLARGLSSNETSPSFLFTLDDVAYANATTGTSEQPTGSNLLSATWRVGNRVSGKALSAKAFMTGSSANVGSYLSTEFQNIARFTVPLAGGTDGFDITEKEPFSQRASGPIEIDGGSTEQNSYAYNSIRVAIDAVSDPEVVEMNLAAIPGIQEQTLTNKLLEVCETRGDALAIIDLKGDYRSEFESKLSADTRKPVVNTAIDNLKNRNLNTSYGCAFFPAVLARDTSAGALVAMPSSVVALGVMASSAAKSELWFAPAGFNRGGLSDGSAGLPVVSVKNKLSSKERDALYEVNINPIASFPAEGIVVFGQKTLQVTSSALDRINVRRLLIYVKKEISRFANTVLFDPNIEVTWARFTGLAAPFLEDVRSRFGLSEYRLVLDSTTTTPELVDRNIVYAKVFLKPTRAIEFIALDFIITRTGASFND